MLHSQHARTSFVAEPTPKQNTLKKWQKKENLHVVLPRKSQPLLQILMFSPKKTVIILHDEEI